MSERQCSTGCWNSLVEPVLSKERRKPDPEKVKATVYMPASGDFRQLRAYLGMVNYCGKYVKNLHQLRAPLDGLLKKSAKLE